MMLTGSGSIEKVCLSGDVSQNHISCSVSAYKTMHLLGLTRVQAKYFFYHSVAAITPAVPTIPLPLFYLCYRKEILVLSSNPSSAI